MHQVTKTPLLNHTSQILPGKWAIHLLSWHLCATTRRTPHWTVQATQGAAWGSVTFANHAGIVHFITHPQDFTWLSFICCSSKGVFHWAGTANDGCAGASCKSFGLAWLVESCAASSLANLFCTNPFVWRIIIGIRPMRLFRGINLQIPCS